MDVANASLYDGASACVEAVNLAVAATGRQTVLLSDGSLYVDYDVMQFLAPRSGGCTLMAGTFVIALLVNLIPMRA